MTTARLRAKRGQGGSVFLREHDGDDTLGYGWVGRIGGMRRQSGIKIIDREIDRVAIGFERAKKRINPPRRCRGRWMGQAMG